MSMIRADLRLCAKRGPGTRRADTCAWSTLASKGKGSDVAGQVPLATLANAQQKTSLNKQQL